VSARRLRTVASAIPEDGDDPERADASAAFAVNAVGPDTAPDARRGFAQTATPEETPTALGGVFRRTR